jgi:sec-independent protein translocase protein TatB
MFDIGWGELVVIGIVALIAIGPKELPTVLRSLGQWMGKIRRMANEFQGQFQEAMREAEMADLKKQADDLVGTVSNVTNFDPLASAQKEMEAALETPAKDANLPAEPTADAAPAVATPPAELAAPLPDIDVPLPDAPAPVTEKDFAPAEAPSPTENKKQAGGGG